MSNYNEEFRKGHETAKIRSRKQALITALLQAVVISIAIFNDFPILIKVLIFILLQFILGGIMSSKWMQSKWIARPQKKSRNLLNMEQFMTEEIARKDPATYTEMSMAKALKDRRARESLRNKSMTPVHQPTTKQELQAQHLRHAQQMVQSLNEVMPKKYPQLEKKNQQTQTNLTQV